MLRVWRRLKLPLPSVHFQRGFSSKQDALQLDNLHAYTSGRWLLQDKLQRSSRYIQFNFSALCDQAIRACPGATRVVGLEKHEGGFNRVFILTMDNGSSVVTRLPTSIAGPPRLATNSEVATMTYLQTRVELPIPKILDWNDDASNPVGAEYIIQEHAVGVQLQKVWPELNPHKHMLCTKALSLAMKKMASLDFPAYGSIYFSDAPIASNLKVPLQQGFCIGPNCSSVFWNRNPGELELYGGPSSNCGPWGDLESYCQGLIDTGFSRLPKGPINHPLRPHQGSIQDHVRLLEISQKVMRKLADDERIHNAAAPLLLHPDFHTRNIFVSAEDPTLITGIIDWQSACIEPAFIYASETPDFAAIPESSGEEIAEDGEADPKPPGLSERDWQDALICHQTFDVVMKMLIPKTRPARLLDDSLFRLFRYCHTSWRDSAPALHRELIELSAHWGELGLQGDCPFSPTEKELENHARDYEDFDTVQRLKLWLKHTLNTNSDGWVPNDTWEATEDAHRAAYNEWIETARESEARGEMTVEKADKLWPFDAR